MKSNFVLNWEFDIKIGMCGSPPSDIVYKI